MAKKPNGELDDIEDIEDVDLELEDAEDETEDAASEDEEQADEEDWEDEEAGEEGEDEEGDESDSSDGGDDRPVQTAPQRDEAELAAIREENARLKKLLELANKTAQTKSKEFLSARRDVLTSQLRDAIEKGLTDEQLKLQNELVDVSIQIANISNAAPTAPKGTSDPIEKKTSQTPSNAATAWLKRNSWYQRNPNGKKARLASQIENKLVSQGYTYDDPATYVELDRRLRLAEKKAKRPAAPKDFVEPESVTTGFVPRGNEGIAPTSSRRITKEDVKKMRSWGFDPNDPKHRKAWLARNSA